MDQDPLEDLQWKEREEIDQDLLDDLQWKEREEKVQNAFKG